MPSWIEELAHEQQIALVDAVAKGIQDADNKINAQALTNMLNNPTVKLTPSPISLFGADNPDCKHNLDACWSEYPNQHVYIEKSTQIARQYWISAQQWLYDGFS